MIVFDLSCSHGHVFEAWFSSSADFEAQRERKLVACPVCDDSHIEKAPMAPAVGLKSNQRADRPATAQTPAAATPDPKALMAALAAFQRTVEQNCDYVGTRFADEARALHLGERATERGIYGETTVDEAKALHEEGIEIMPLPFRPRTRSDA